MYLDKLGNVNTGSGEVFDKYLNTILLTVNKESLVNELGYVFLKLISHNNTDNVSKYSVISVSITLGKKVVQNFLRIKKSENSSLSYSEFVKDFESKNKDFSLVTNYDDTFYSKIGTILMEVLMFSNLVGVKTTTLSFKEKRLDYYVLDKKLLNTNKLKVTPINLPMIVPPKDYTNNTLGGYILNDDTYKLDIMTNKLTHKYVSTISDDNKKLFYIVNNTSKVNFKVNTELLDILKNDLGTKILLQNNIIEEIEK